MNQKLTVTLRNCWIDRSWPLRFDNMELNTAKQITTRSTSLPHRGRSSVKTPYTTTILIVNLCYYVVSKFIISRHPVSGAKQSGIPANRKVQMNNGRAHEILWLYLLALGHQQMVSPHQRPTKSLSFTRPNLLEDATPGNLIPKSRRVILVI